MSQLNPGRPQLLAARRQFLAIICDGLPANRPDFSSGSVGKLKTAAGELLGVRLAWGTEGTAVLSAAAKHAAAVERVARAACLFQSLTGIHPNQLPADLYDSTFARAVFRRSENRSHDVRIV